MNFFLLSFIFSALFNFNVAATNEKISFSDEDLMFEHPHKIMLLSEFDYFVG